MKKKAMIYMPFLIVIILFFNLILNSNYVIKNIKTYLNYENIYSLDEIDDINNFVSQLGNYKDEYYSFIDSLEEEDNIYKDLTFLDYIEKNKINLFRGKFHIIDSVKGNKGDSQYSKILFYSSVKNNKGYYFYTIDNGRNIDLNIAHLFKA